METKTIGEMAKEILGDCVEELTTKDIYLASALHSLDIEYLGVDKTDPDHQKFKFKGKRLKELERQWINKELIGNLSMFADSIRMFKSIIHAVS